METDFDEICDSLVKPPEWQNPTPGNQKYSLVVIGAGTAGLVAAGGIGLLGGKVALIERERFGGDCLNTGCVPSKVIISEAKKLKTTSEEAFSKMKRIRAKIAQHDSAERLKKEFGVDVFFGDAAFAKEGEIKIGSQSIFYKKCCIASGGRPRLLNQSIVKDNSIEFLSSENVFYLTSLPKSMIVVGGGPIGCEMAQSFARLGCKVTLVHSKKSLLNASLEQASAIVMESLMKEENLSIVLNCELKEVNKTKEGTISVLYEKDGKSELAEAEKILLAIGRLPNVESLNLEKVNVIYDPVAGIQVDNYLRTSNSNIWASGDCANIGYKFTHAAEATSRVMLENAFFFGNTKWKSLLIPHCTYTQPEIAQIGNMNEEGGNNIDVHFKKFDEIDRNLCNSETNGFVKILTNKKSGLIVGATIVCDEMAGELLAEITLAMKFKIPFGKLASIVRPYPNRGEIIKILADEHNIRSMQTPRMKWLISWFV